MSSEIDKLIGVITDLVLAELTGQAEAPSNAPAKPPEKKSGLPLLVCPGPRAVDASFWKGLTEARGFLPSLLSVGKPGGAPADWRLESRVGQWDKIVSGYRAVVLLGSDLSVLSSIANLGSGGGPSASAAVAGLAGGLPVFVDNSCFESIRRHSSRLSSGFVGRFEEFYRMVSSFGVEFGGPNQLLDFLARLGGAAPAAADNRSTGRAVVTVEDVEAIKRSGGNRMEVAMGSIITPLAAQRALEWGVEVVIQ
ncbi:MAG: hypothetical protein WC314_00710 [Vulcanimicrobiota bacterium]